mmetsp:Transcript_29579/g.50239  ORF Transcript_29579/g.50239 Transcript_29579/m.50239 type:complete len:282 (+) Transcript_29579:1551-2396(+)
MVLRLNGDRVDAGEILLRGVHQQRQGRVDARLHAHQLHLVILHFHLHAHHRGGVDGDCTVLSLHFHLQGQRHRGRIRHGDVRCSKGQGTVVLDPGHGHRTGDADDGSGLAPHQGWCGGGMRLKSVLWRIARSENFQHEQLHGLTVVGEQDVGQCELHRHRPSNVVHPLDLDGDDALCLVLLDEPGLPRGQSTRSDELGGPRCIRHQSVSRVVQVNVRPARPHGVPDGAPHGEVGHDGHVAHGAHGVGGEHHVGGCIVDCGLVGFVDAHIVGGPQATDHKGQ